MQNQLLPVLMKQRIRAVGAGDSYKFATGGCFAEVFYDCTGAMFQMDVNSKSQERARKRARANTNHQARAAVDEPGTAAADQQEEMNDDAGSNAQVADARVDQPEIWSDDHFAWRHPLTFRFVLNGPLAYLSRPKRTPGL